MGPSVLETPSGWQSGIERVLAWLVIPALLSCMGPGGEQAGGARLVEQNKRCPGGRGRQRGREDRWEEVETC